MHHVHLHIPADLFLDVIVPDHTTEETIKQLGVDLVVGLGLVNGLTVNPDHHVRVYAKDNLNSADVSIEERTDHKTDVVVTVRGGVAYVDQTPPGLTVKIVDLDNEPDQKL